MLSFVFQPKFPIAAKAGFLLLLKTRSVSVEGNLILVNLLALVRVKSTKVHRIYIFHVAIGGYKRREVI